MNSQLNRGAQDRVKGDMTFCSWTVERAVVGPSCRNRKAAPGDLGKIKSFNVEEFEELGK